jgi:hypothetical protein
MYDKHTGGRNRAGSWRPRWSLPEGACRVLAWAVTITSCDEDDLTTPTTPLCRAFAILCCRAPRHRTAAHRNASSSIMALFPPPLACADVPVLSLTCKALGGCLMPQAQSVAKLAAIIRWWQAITRPRACGALATLYHVVLDSQS